MLVVTSAWLCRREAVGLALKGTSGGIRSRAIYLSCSLMIGLRQGFYKWCIHALCRVEFTWDEVVNCVFSSLLLTSGWDQTGSVVCLGPFSLHIWALPQAEFLSGLRGGLGAVREFIHLSEKASLLSQVLQVRWAVSAQALPLGGETLSVSRLREEVCSKRPLVQTRQGASIPPKQPLRPLRELISPAFPFPPSRPTAADDSTLLTIFLVIIYLSSHNSQCCYLIPPCLSVPCPLKMIWEWSSFWVRGGGCSSFFVFFFFKDVIFLSSYLSLLSCCFFWKLQCFIFSCFLLHMKM